MKRTKHSLGHYKLLTCDMGKLVPVGCYEVLPGDTVQHHTAALIRVSPLVAPVMHPVTVRFHHWFVPHRLVWDGWEDFITGGPDGIGGDAGAYPTISSGTGFAAKSLADYFGIPPTVANLVVSALPFRAYARIFNEYYRDQDLVPEVAESSGSGADSITNQDVQNIAWQKDYFTSARPWPQKGPDVSMPLGGNAPVYVNRVTDETDGVQYGTTWIKDSANQGDIFGTSPPGLPAAAFLRGFADLGQATAVNVNDVRRAFALQRYQEARAAYGSRYTEYLRYLGVRSSDARLQRPEYIGGGKQVISFSEVLRTGSESAPADPEVGPIGEMKGHGIAAMRSRRTRRFFEEHGHVITLMSVRPKTMYASGLHRSWSRRTKEDYWQRELESIGQQELYRREVYAEGDNAGAGGDTIFGYQDRYSDYRHLPSEIAGDFRSTLNYWHLGRIFGSAPALNQSFVECDPSKRIHAVQTEDVLWCMVNHDIRARRMVGKRVIGRIF